jgi:hypothetical protein
MLLLSLSSITVVINLAVAAFCTGIPLRLLGAEGKDTRSYLEHQVSLWSQVSGIDRSWDSSARETEKEIRPEKLAIGVSLASTYKVSFLRFSYTPRYWSAGRAPAPVQRCRRCLLQDKVSCLPPPHPLATFLRGVEDQLAILQGVQGPWAVRIIRYRFCVYLENSTLLLSLTIN